MSLALANENRGYMENSRGSFVDPYDVYFGQKTFAIDQKCSSRLAEGFGAEYPPIHTRILYITRTLSRCRH